MNLYGFAGGDPVNFADPFGLKVECANAQSGAVWNQLVTMARNAMGSADGGVAAAGRSLNGMLRGIWDSESTMRIDVGHRNALSN